MNIFLNILVAIICLLVGYLFGSCNMSILIVGGLAFISAYRAGLFNIGISGQMVAGGTAATLICHLAKITPGVNQVIILITWHQP